MNTKVPFKIVFFKVVNLTDPFGNLNLSMVEAH